MSIQFYLMQDYLSKALSAFTSLPLMSFGGLGNLSELFSTILLLHAIKLYF